ncbi:hypothetical protein [Haloquadratum walsbyi]|uniref:Uncharacterized protein n=1 Tax=Haloquadratum walsbyi J07HQW2 TaxID=1238425 RepID=U1PL72_9EURY|nr:MAG: hypothetical protein J07HQW2_00871 [Haloquadratum walsbyi J07HQW2]
MFVFFFFERVAGVQHVLIRERDRGDICHSEVDSCHAVAWWVGRFDLEFTNEDEVEFPFVTVPDGTNVLYAGDLQEVTVWPSLVLPKQELREVFCQM